MLCLCSSILWFLCLHRPFCFSVGRDDLSAAWVLQVWIWCCTQVRCLCEVLLFWGPEVVCLWPSTALCRRAGFLICLSWGSPAHLCITWCRHACVCKTPAIINDWVGNKGMHLRYFLRAVQGLSMLTATPFILLFSLDILIYFSTN